MELVERDDVVRATVAATLRTVAEWGLSFDDGKPVRDELFQVAEQVDGLTPDQMCCPVCEEITCDEGCPLASIRNREA